MAPLKAPQTAPLPGQTKRSHRDYGKWFSFLTSRSEAVLSLEASISRVWVISSPTHWAMSGNWHVGMDAFLEALSFAPIPGTGEFSLVSEMNSILVEYWFGWEPMIEDSKWAGSAHNCPSTMITNDKLVGLESESSPSTSLRHSRALLFLPTSYHGLYTCSFWQDGPGAKIEGSSS